MSVRGVVKREVRVALSKKAQPVWFRLLKWVVILIVCALFYRHPYFWWGILAALIVSLALHGFWRWKTKGWTQPWGGWNDLDSGRR